MAVPRVICDANIELNYSASAQLVSLSGTGTESPTSWEWTMLAVPPGSTANVGVNVDFTDGVATIQNPDFNTTAGVSGAYVFQLVATNGEGSSDPTIDRESGQQIVLVKTEHRSLIVPGKYQYNWGDYFNVTLNDLINTKLDALEVPDANTTLNVEVGKHGLCPALSGTVTEFLDGSGNFSTPSETVPSVHGTTHDGIDTDPIPDVTTSAAGLCPALSNVASEYLDGQGNWNPPTAGPHNTSHISTGSDAVPILTTTETGLCPALPSVSPTTKYLRGDATWDTPPTLGAHGTDHIDSGSDVIPVATASNTGLMPIRSNVVTQYLDGTGNWSVPSAGGGGTLDGAYNGGESITVDALPVTLDRTQTADDQPAQKFNHDYDGNQGSGIEFIGTSSANIPDGETIRGANISVPKQTATADLWYAIGGTTIAKKEGGSWSSVAHGLTITKIHDIKGFAADDIWICGTAPNGSNGKPFIAHFDGTGWAIDSDFDTAAGSIDYGIARSLLITNELEIYTLIEQTNIDHLWVGIRHVDGAWIVDHEADVDGPYYDMAKNGSEFGFGRELGLGYTTNVYADNPSPTWAYNGWISNRRPHGFIYDTNGSRYVAAQRIVANQYISFSENTSDLSAAFSYVNEYDGGSGDYVEANGYIAHSMWHDGAGKIFHTANHSGSNHVFIHSIETTPVGVATTDKVFGMYGLSATDIKMGTDKTGYLKTWNGVSIGDEDVGIAVDFDQVWGLADASGTAKFEGCKVAFTGSGVNEASAVRIGSGATHAIKADSGIITLGKMTEAKHVVNSGSFYTKEVSSKVEAHYKDNSSNIVQLTKNGNVYGKDVVRVYFDDTTVSTTSASYVYRKDTFFYACDIDRQPVSWDIVATLWNDGGTSAQCEVTVYGYTVEMSSTESAESSAAIVKGTIANSALVVQETVSNVYFRIKATGGGTAYLKYAEIYAVYEELYA